ncbi:hypothetical protein AVEN_63194-1 [Araneus ventricosus]|uniref:Uncharacterized protein n=1 Tax=Araneus ventricosus TaxID=182803 RepID=A0A4Y2B0L4_ARAVE|nr:hypothetical protein AVEN_63194-1 [Araneus ventricosus]
MPISNIKSWVVFPSTFSYTSTEWCALCLVSSYCEDIRRGGKVSVSGLEGSRPDSIEEPPCKWVWCTLNLLGPNSTPKPPQNRLVWCGNLKRECLLRYRPRHLTTIQNDDIYPKIALVLLQNGMFKAKLVKRVECGFWIGTFSY